MGFVLGVVVAGRGRAVVADGRRASRARARFREVVLHGAKDVENEFRVSELYLGVRGATLFVAESGIGNLAWLCDDRFPPLNATLNARDAREEAQASGGEKRFFATC